MEIQQDFKELLELLNSNKVEYVIVGGYAVAFHGHPRFTGDIDIYVNPTQGNAERVLKALDEFGFGGTGIEIDDLSNPGKVIQLGHPPVRIDIITSISGVTPEEAFKDFDTGEYGKVPVRFLNRDKLIANKRTIGRKKDLADLEALGEE